MSGPLADCCSDAAAWIAAARLQVLPYFLFYRGRQGKLEEFSASIKKVAALRCVSVVCPPPHLDRAAALSTAATP